MHFALSNRLVNAYLLWVITKEAFAVEAKHYFSRPQQILRVLVKCIMAWLTNFSAYWSVSN